MNYHYGANNSNQEQNANVVSNMHMQAMDFIGVLKSLIQDTVQQQRVINQQMFPGAPLNQYASAPLDQFGQP